MTSIDKRINIIIVDDHPAMVTGLKTLLKESAGYYIIDDFSKIRHLLAAEDLDPHVIILDINLQDMDGLKGIGEIRKKFPNRKIIAHTAYDHLEEKLKQLNFDGYVVKECSPQILLEAIASVMQDIPYFNTLLNAKIREEKLAAFRLKYNITPRELEIIEMIMTGNSNPQTATKEFISPLTVKTHRRNIYEKIGVSSTVELMSFVISQGISF